MKITMRQLQASIIGQNAADAGGRFGFGENWKSYLAQLDDARIAEAEKSLRWLVGRERLTGVHFLDIGSGSGLSSLAARRLGAHVVSFDHDAQSVECTTGLRDRFFPGDPDWRVEQGSILDRDYLDKLGRFDIVYSWGVLHHTGAMVDAIENAARLVPPDGMLVIALYRKTLLCRFWALEKRWYCQTSSRAQAVARGLYVGLMRLGFVVLGRNFPAYIADYRSKRGMDYIHDVHDWLGGYPYESIGPADVAKNLTALKFEHVRSKVQPASIGLFGSGCDEFVYRRAGLD
jgi:2-polyprenyl-6-hydroxyphenyl methylase/3-demethylubiquinone-9 3-methyltransferase